MDCLFCKIVKQEIPATITYQDDLVIAFNDIHPQAPQHQLIIPIKHIATLNDVHHEDTSLIGHMMQTAVNIAKTNGLDGYRLVMNCNAIGGQEVFHIHLHLLGGRQMHWPPG